MKKALSFSMISLLVLSFAAAPTVAFAVSGICSGSSCGGALAAKGSDVARQHSLKKLNETYDKLDKNPASNSDEMAKYDKISKKAYDSHRKVVGQWVSKKHPQLKPGSEEHDSMTDSEMATDMQGEKPEPQPKQQRLQMIL